MPEFQMKIVIDSREQKPLTFRGIETVSKKLSVGDYSIEGMEHLVAVERKSPMDLYQTLSRGNERFQKELLRGCNLDLFILLIETSFTCVRDKTFVESHRTKMLPNVILDILFTLKCKHRIEVVFCNNRSESSSYIRYLFKKYYHYRRKERHMKFDDIKWARRIMALKRRLKVV